MRTHQSKKTNLQENWHIHESVFLHWMLFELLWLIYIQHIHKMLSCFSKFAAWYSTNLKLKKPGIRAAHVTLQKHHTVCQTHHPNHKQKAPCLAYDIKQQFHQLFHPKWIHLNIQVFKFVLYQIGIFDIHCTKNCSFYEKLHVFSPQIIVKFERLLVQNSYYSY